MYKYFKRGKYTPPIIKHQLTGSGVIMAGFMCHAFCPSRDLDWYEQKWSNISHKQIGRCVDSEEQVNYNKDYMMAGIIPVMNWIEGITSSPTTRTEL